MGEVFDQEGNPVTQQMIHAERIKLHRDRLEAKRPEFEEALEDRCKRDNEVYRNLGVHPQVGEVIYQVGMNVYAIQVGPDGLYANALGRVG